jgi:hypothetical protein
VLIHGIDWSGAVDAGRRIWIATCRRSTDRLEVNSLRRAEDLPGGSRKRDVCIAALLNWIHLQGPCAIGLDFPFGLPAALVEESDWSRFALNFPRRFSSAQAFRDWCNQRAGGRELKRVTDREARTPFCPYNLRMYRQTYWGIAAVLAPLVEQQAAVVLPMQKRRIGIPWLLESCPASALKQKGLYAPYKGNAPPHQAQRSRILSALRKDGLRIPPRFLRIAMEDAAGDALDAVIAAEIAARNTSAAQRLRPAPTSSAYALEAYVYR